MAINQFVTVDCQSSLYYSQDQYRNFASFCRNSSTFNCRHFLTTNQLKTWSGELLPAQMLSTLVLQRFKHPLRRLIKRGPI